MHVIEHYRLAAADLRANPSKDLSVAVLDQGEIAEHQHGGYAAGNVVAWMSYDLMVAGWPEVAEVTTDALDAGDWGFVEHHLSMLTGEDAAALVDTVIATTADPGRPASLANM